MAETGGYGRPCIPLNGFGADVARVKRCRTGEIQEATFDHSTA